MCDSHPQEVRGVILGWLCGTHSAWRYWYLENGRYDDEQEEMSKAIDCGLAPKVFMKLALVCSSPGLGRKLSSISTRYF